MLGVTKMPLNRRLVILLAISIVVATGFMGGQVVAALVGPPPAPSYVDDEGRIVLDSVPERIAALGPDGEPVGWLIIEKSKDGWDFLRDADGLAIVVDDTGKTIGRFVPPAVEGDDVPRRFEPLLRNTGNSQ